MKTILGVYQFENMVTNYV